MENIQDLDKLADSLNNAIQEISTKQNEKAELERKLFNIATEKGQQLIEFFKELEPLSRAYCTLGDKLKVGFCEYQLTGFSIIYKNTFLVEDVKKGIPELGFNSHSFLRFEISNDDVVVHFRKYAESVNGYLLYVEDLEGAKKSIINAFIKHIQYLKKKAATVSDELDKIIASLTEKLKSLEEPKVVETNEGILITVGDKVYKAVLINED